ncbi:IS481 family transposase [Knoellia sp. S7-12]|uniref:IS481 family transposase n=1 Tax=Knoellia sp. S7-12 TaxID=3126698 RepID=UPI00336930EE
MAKDGVAVGPELAALVTRFVGGERFNIREACAEIGVSTTTFYKYRHRFDELGVDGLFPMSRAPLVSPTRVSTAVEEVIVRVRKEMTGDGWDAGAEQIRFRLEALVEAADPQWPVGADIPSRATINRVLKRRGQLIAVPQRKPKRATRRFEAAQPNTRWQMDGFAVTLDDGTDVVVLHIVDDHSRYDIGLRAAHSENAADVWTTVAAAAKTYGLPREFLTDNGTAFSGRRRGWLSALEENLTILGVKTITSSVGHPQTCGKCERAHQTVLKWLAVRSITSIDHLNKLLVTYRHHQNNDRRRTHLGGLTPGQRYRLGPKDGPAGDLALPMTVRSAVVAANGAITVDKTSIGIGRRYAGTTITLFRQGNIITIVNDRGHVADLTLTTPRSRYQSANPTARLTAKS